MLTVLAKPHALKQELVQANFPAGMTLSEILGVDPDGLLRVTVNSVDVPRRVWPHLRPRAGSTICARMGLQGGNGGKLLRTVALIAIAYLSMGVASGALEMYGSSMFAAGSLSAAVASIGVTMVGSLQGAALTAQGMQP